MGRGVGRRVGGITGLVELLTEHAEAVEADLIDRGLRQRWLGTEDLTWPDLRAVVRNLPEDSALVRAMDPEAAKWTGRNGMIQLLHSVEHHQRILAWQQTEDGSKGRNVPKPLPAPWVEPEKDTKKFGGDAVPWDEMTSWLGWEAQMTTEGG